MRLLEIRPTFVHCDRCKRDVEGYIGKMASSGVYVTDRGFWQKFANPGESVVCDDCMHVDPRYVAIYGPPPPRVR